MSKKERKKAEKPGKLPILWTVDKAIISQHATNLVVQTNPQEVLLSFFEALPPILLGSPSEVQEQLTKMRGLEAHCVARIVITPARFKEFIQVLNQTVDQMKEENQ